MITLKELRIKRKSVEGISQLTKALKVVSQNKLLKAQHQWHKGRKEFLFTLMRLKQLQYVRDVENNIAGGFLNAPNEPREPKVLIVLSSDRGFCGAFNTKIQKLTMHCLKTFSKLQCVIMIGKKISALGPSFSSQYPHIQFEYIHNIQMFSQKKIKEWLGELHQNVSCFESCDLCYVIYAHYINALTQDIVCAPLGMFDDPELLNKISHELPTHTHWNPMEKDATVGALFENTIPMLRPDADSVIEMWKKMCFFQQFLSLLYEHFVSEHNARMRAMEKAGDNAKDLLSELQKQYNNLRQGTITKELVEITAGVQSMEN